MGTPEVQAVVVGAGIAGLAAGLELQGAGSEVLVIDASDRPGGVMRTDHVSGYVIERGPNTVQVKAPMRDFLARRGLGEVLLRASPASRLRFLWRDGSLVPVPLSPLALARSPLLTTRGKLRLAVEPFVRRGNAERETVAEFVKRRLGREAVSALVGPFLTGIYAGDEDQLGAGAVFGSLAALERRFGSLGLGLLLGAPRRRSSRGLPGSWSAESGLGPFARRLAEMLSEPPALGTRVQRIARDEGGWRIDLSSASGEQQLMARRVAIATPAFAAAQMLRGVDPEVAAALEAIVYAPLAGVAVGVAPTEVRERIEGFGFLVPREEALGLLGCLFMSQLFPGRAPAGHELLQCMVGGVRWPEVVHAPDDAIVERLGADLERTLGLRTDPNVLAVTRWERAVPQPDREHLGRMAFVHANLPPGLALAGSYLAGVGVSDSLASGVEAAMRLMEG